MSIFFRLRALQKRWLERRRRSFEAGIIMKQRGDKLLLKGSFRVLPSSSSVKSLNSARGSKRFLPGCTRCPMHYTTRSVLLSRLDGKYLLARRLKTNLSEKLSLENNSVANISPIQNCGFLYYTCVVSTIHTLYLAKKKRNQSWRESVAI